MTFVLVCKNCLVDTLEELAFHPYFQVSPESGSRYQIPYPGKERLQDHHRTVSKGCSETTAGNGILPVLLLGQRQMYSHLVTVEVSVECGTNSGCSLIALPSTRIGSNAWIPRRCRVGARFSITGCSLMTSSRTSHTGGSKLLYHFLGSF